MTSLRQHASTLALALAFCQGLWAQNTPNPATPNLAYPIGVLEVSGARLGMPFALALDALEATKPAWTGLIEASRSGALYDCSAHGRVLLALSLDPTGRPSTMMDAQCSAEPKSAPVLRSIEIKTLIAPGLTRQDIRLALASRYGGASNEAGLPGGGFELTWRAGLGVLDAELLHARLDSSPVDSVPQALTLGLSRPSAAGLAPDQAAPALRGLPF